MSEIIAAEKKKSIKRCKLKLISVEIKIAAITTHNNKAEVVVNAIAQCVQRALNRR